jgi:hypothetical protein
VKVLKSFSNTYLKKKTYFTKTFCTEAMDFDVKAEQRSYITGRDKKDSCSYYRLIKAHKEWKNHVKCFGLFWNTQCSDGVLNDNIYIYNCFLRHNTVTSNAYISSTGTSFDTCILKIREGR